MELMVPFLRGLPESELEAGRTVIFGRPKSDFVASCLLFQSSGSNSITADDVQRFRSSGFRVCYSYETLDLENREFTEDGYRAICEDLHRAIEWGFTHIQLSNPYVIELVTNEFGPRLSVILSSQLEFNSARARVFLDVLNNPSHITHLVVSQNQLTQERFSEMRLAFAGIQLVVEVDRWLSDVQIIHERYYNTLYGHDSIYGRLELKRLTSLPAMRQALSPVQRFLFDSPELVYKVGEINSSLSLVLANIGALQHQHFELLRNADLEMWSCR